MKLKGTAVLRITRGWVVAEVPESLADYYRKLLPKTLRYNLPRHTPHVTVIRDYPDTLPTFVPREISFEYSPCTVIGREYIWLDVWCPELEQFRESLGYEPVEWYTRPPEGDVPFHITIGNFK